MELEAKEPAKKFRRTGAVGAIIAKPTRAQTIKLTILHFGLIIRDLGKSSRKSAPLIPKESEIIVNAPTRNIDSKKPSNTISNGGTNNKPLTTEQTKVTIRLKTSTNPYFALKKFLAETGDENKYHTLSPSEPVIMPPILTAISAPGRTDM